MLKPAKIPITITLPTTEYNIAPLVSSPLSPFLIDGFDIIAVELVVIIDVDAVGLTVDAVVLSVDVVGLTVDVVGLSVDVVGLSVDVVRLTVDAVDLSVDVVALTVDDIGLSFTYIVIAIVLILDESFLCVT